mmetsp:Transcript_41567/g.97276  ORF Transcript_41567/g.97276 Transcript_41567/m.97276 type:complete len:109 (+) Transcript_41567:516-842(+)
MAFFSLKKMVSLYCENTTYLRTWHCVEWTDSKRILIHKEEISPIFRFDDITQLFLVHSAKIIIVALYRIGNKSESQSINLGSKEYVWLRDTYLFNPSLFKKITSLLIG